MRIWYAKNHINIIYRNFQLFKGSDETIRSCVFIYFFVKWSNHSSFDQAECSDRKGWQKDVQPSQGLWAIKTWLQFMILILMWTSKTYWRNRALKKHFHLFQFPKSPCVAHSALHAYLTLNKEISTLENLAIVPVPPRCPTHSPLPHSQPHLSVIAGSNTLRVSQHFKASTMQLQSCQKCSLD